MHFFQLIKRFVPPYKVYMALNILFNLLSTVLSLFSFAAIIPVLRILFGIPRLDAQQHHQSFSDAAHVFSVDRQLLYLLRL